jgi:hypothetical protein
MIQTEIIKTYAALLKLLLRDDVEIKSFRDLNGCAVSVTYVLLDEADESNTRKNYILAAFVTAHARVVLYFIMDHLGTSILYCDTGEFLIKGK